jgi:hypothetical protein
VSDDDIVGIEIRSGVNEEGVGFNTVVVSTQGGQMLLGQLDPGTVRTMALDWLGAAEAAETDGIVFRLLTERFGLEPEIAGGFVVSMRDLRDDGDDG